MGNKITVIVCGVAICAASLWFAVESFKLAQEEKKKRRELEKEIERLNEKAAKENRIDHETIEQIETVNTGNIDTDFDNGVNLLHQLAGKRKS